MAACAMAEAKTQLWRFVSKIWTEVSTSVTILQCLTKSEENIKIFSFLHGALVLTNRFHWNESYSSFLNFDANKHRRDDNSSGQFRLSTVSPAFCLSAQWLCFISLLTVQRVRLKASCIVKEALTRGELNKAASVSSGTGINNSACHALIGWSVVTVVSIMVPATSWLSVICCISPKAAVFSQNTCNTEFILSIFLCRAPSCVLPGRVFLLGTGKSW